MSTPWDSFIKWLSEPWWDGVAGLVGVVALIAVVVALVEFGINRNAQAPRSMAFTVQRSQMVIDDLIEVTVTARPMGPRVLYEAEAMAWGFKPFDPLPDIPSVFTASDEPVTIHLQVPVSEIRNASVGIGWVEPHRLRSHAGASRVHLQDHRYEWWTPYRWLRWPRRKPGYWTSNGEAGDKLTPLSRPTD